MHRFIRIASGRTKLPLKLLLLSSGKLEPGGGSTVAGGSVGSGDNQPNRLLLVIHHLAVDGVSWRILLEDLQQAYQQLSQER